MAYKITLPFTDRNFRLCLTAGRGTYMALNIKNEVKHRDKDCGVPLVYKCRRCQKTFASLNSVQCHMPKCKGTPLKTSADGVVCPCCGKFNKGKTGLTTHLRHARTPDKPMKLELRLVPECVLKGRQGECLGSSLRKSSPCRTSRSS